MTTIEEARKQRVFMQNILGRGESEADKGFELYEKAYAELEASIEAKVKIKTYTTPIELLKAIEESENE